MVQNLNIGPKWSLSREWLEEEAETATKSYPRIGHRECLGRRYVCSSLRECLFVATDHHEVDRTEIEA